jgi:hypothetical protein
MIIKAISVADSGQKPTPGPATKRKGGWWSSIAALPATVVALLPGVACPACWPAYAGLLNVFGLGFINYSPYLAPLTGGLLVLSVGLLAYRAKRRRGYRPFMLGLLATTGVMIGRFVLESNAFTYGSLALLITASLWNAWPRNSINTCTRCECEPQK